MEFLHDNVLEEHIKALRQKHGKIPRRIESVLTLFVFTSAAVCLIFVMGTMYIFYALLQIAHF